MYTQGNPRHGLTPTLWNLLVTLDTEKHLAGAASIPVNRGQRGPQMLLSRKLCPISKIRHTFIHGFVLPG